MAKTKPRHPAPRPVPAPAKPIGKWILYGILGTAALALVVFLAIPPEKPLSFEDVPGGLPEGIEEVVVGDPVHIDGPIGYDRLVPAGGAHSPTPVTCTIYDDPIPAERAVHSLEHGAVWVTYQSKDAIDLGTLERLARSRIKVILSPVPDQESPILATSWGWQLELHDAGDIRLRQFIQAVQGQFSKAPESGAPC